MQRDISISIRWLYMYVFVSFCTSSIICKYLPSKIVALGLFMVSWFGIDMEMRLKRGLKCNELGIGSSMTMSLDLVEMSVLILEKRSNIHILFVGHQAPSSKMQRSI
jgi:hypothetical protein